MQLILSESSGERAVSAHAGFCISPCSLTAFRWAQGRSEAISGVGEVQTWVRIGDGKRGNSKTVEIDGDGWAV